MCSFLWLSNIPLCIYTTTFYPFICLWTSRLPPWSSYLNSAAMNNGIQMSLSILVSSGYMPRSGIAGRESEWTRSWWWTGRPGVLWFMGLQRVGHDWVTELNWTNDPAIQLLGIYPEETKTEKDTCIPLFIATLFTIGRTWKQPRCPSTDEGINKLWYIYTM